MKKNISWLRIKRPGCSEVRGSHLAKAFTLCLPKGEGEGQGVSGHSLTCWPAVSTSLLPCSEAGSCSLVLVLGIPL